MYLKSNHHYSRYNMQTRQFTTMTIQVVYQHLLEDSPSLSLPPR
jgi:hypothetical protein